MPGQELGGTGLKPGMGTYRMAGTVYAAQLGIRDERSGFVNVMPLAGRYMPRPGDSVIGLVQDVGPSNWMVDIHCPYIAFLHANETQWKVDFGAAGQFLTPGDTVLAKVGMVDEVKRVNLTMKEQGLRKLARGQIMKVNHSRVPRVIGRGGSMISMLKEHTACRIFIGQNGVVWIDGELEGIALAVAAISMIDRGVHRDGLTESVRAFLDARKVGGK